MTDQNAIVIGKNTTLEELTVKISREM